MADVEYAFVADYAADYGGRISAMGIGFDLITTLQIPAVHSAYLVLRMSFRQDECGSVHRVELLFQGPDGQRAAEGSINVEVAWPDDHPFNTVSINAVSAMPMPLQVAGMHRLDINIDGEPKREIDVNVVLGARPDDAP